jgi:hypothetical protein
MSTTQPPARKPTRSESRATPAHVKAQYAPDTPIPKLNPERATELLEQRRASSKELQLRIIQQKRIFIDTYGIRANLTQACDAAGIKDLNTPHHWAKIDSDFARDWDQATIRATDAQRAILWEQAEKNPLLLMFSLKKLDPTYKDSFKIDVSHSVNDSSLDLSKLSTSELELFLELQRKASSVDVIDAVSHVLEDSIDT